MTRVPELVRLARSCGPDPEDALLQVLRLLLEQLDARTALLGRALDGVHVVELAVSRERGRVAVREGVAPEPPDPRVFDGPVLLERLTGPLSDTHGLGAYAALRLRTADGTDAGVLEVVGPPRAFDDADRDVLEGLGDVVADLAGPWRAVEAGGPRPPSADLVALAAAVSRAEGLEGVARPLLDALHAATGLASTYLTVVHEDSGVQEIRVARNAKEGFAVPEGLRVPWADTLCKRALEEGRACTTDVPAVWGDSDAAAALGIVTYVSVPVRLSDGTLLGTLCGADDVARPAAADALPVLSMFATLLAAEVERGG